ncbi:MAG: phosphate-starvation-inducible PsiE family protein [Candidatus Nanohaloarchaea archaeon]
MASDLGEEESNQEKEGDMTGDTTRFENMLARKADRLMDILQLTVVYLLVILFSMGVIDLGIKLYTFIASGKVLNATRVVSLLDTVLLLFLIVEVFRTTVAHLEDMKVLPLVIDIAIIGVARSLITFRVAAYKTTSDAFMAALSYSVVLLVLIGGFYIVHRQERKPLDPHPHKGEEDESEEDQ